MITRKTFAAAAALLCGGLSAGSAQAIGYLEFSIERLSNTELTITGQFPTDGAADTIYLLDLISTETDALVSLTGPNTLTIGSAAVTGYAQTADDSLALTFSTLFDDGDSPSGSITLEIADGMLADLGTTGSFSYTENGTPVGGWEIDSGLSQADIEAASTVPLPPALMLTGAGLAALGLVGRRRRRG